MNQARVAVRCGPVTMTEPQLRDAMNRTMREMSAGIGDVTSGQLVLINDTDRLSALVVALAVRAAGAVPLLGDDRWDASFWERLQKNATDPAAVPLAPDTAWAAFSSGSSGTPRMIVRTERSWSASFAAVSTLMDLADTDNVYLPSPLSASLSLFSVIQARSAGAGIVLPRSHSVSASDLEFATVMHGTPFALRAVVEVLEDGQSPHRLRLALIGGAHLDTEIRDRAETLGIRVVCYYGAAELSFVAVDADGLGFLPFPGAELRIDDGELWVRSPYVASGYHGADGALRRDHDGWATVGDLVDIDATGRLQVRGRRDGAIMTAAATVVPEEVEAALRMIDGIEDAAVFGIPNAGIGHLVGALIQTTVGQPVPSVRQLRQRAATRLAPSHLPRHWYWSEQLPRTAVGKLARSRIADEITTGRATKLV